MHWLDVGPEHSPSASPNPSPLPPPLPAASTTCGRAPTAAKATEIVMEMTAVMTRLALSVKVVDDGMCIGLDEMGSELGPDRHPP